MAEMQRIDYVYGNEDLGVFGIHRHGPAIGTNYCYINGALLANYLAGTNSAGNAIRWPAFQGSSATNFTGKYSQRQWVRGSLSAAALRSAVSFLVDIGQIPIRYPFKRFEERHRAPVSLWT
jgi:hypothetical protein